MMSFNEDNFLVCEKLVPLKTCNALATHIREQFSLGKMTQDVQCPLSWSIHGDVKIDGLLSSLTRTVEAWTNCKLIPTYSYARIYKKGEVLKKHTDRPACEYSVTLTLAMDKKHPWPVWFGTTEVKEAKVGMGIVYKGCEIEHWREPYEGEEQIQVFLHYVDANGPYKDEKYDHREELGTPKAPADIFYWYFAGGLDNTYCDNLVSSLDKDYEKFIDGLVGSGGSGLLSTNVRDVKKMPLNPFNGVGPHLIGLGFLANRQAWKFDIETCNQVDYLRYKEDGHYLEHMDTFMQFPSVMRKLSVLAFLDDDFEGGKLFLKSGHHKMYPPQDKGTVLVFPSFLLHGVEPVTKGIRHSIICWLEGPAFR